MSYLGEGLLIAV